MSDRCMIFKGDRRKTFDMNRAYGPGNDHKIIWPVSISYDEEKDVTRVACSDQVPEHMFPKLVERDDS